MKKITLLTCLLFLFSCSKGDNNTANSKFEGTWRLNDIQLVSPNTTISLDQLASLTSNENNISKSTVLNCYKSTIIQFTGTNFSLTTDTTDDFCKSGFEKRNATFTFTDTKLNFNPPTPILIIDDANFNNYSYSFESDGDLKMFGPYEESISFEMYFTKQ